MKDKPTMTRKQAKIRAYLLASEYLIATLQAGAITSENNADEALICQGIREIAAALEQRSFTMEVGRAPKGYHRIRKRTTMKN